MAKPAEDLLGLQEITHGQWWLWSSKEFIHSSMADSSVLMWPLPQEASSFIHALDFIHTLWVLCLLSGTMVSQSEHSLRMSFSCHSCHVLNSKTDPAGSRHILQLVNGGLVTKSCLTLATPWTVAHQDPLFMEFSRQENWSGLPFPSPGDLTNPGIKTASLPASPQVVSCIGWFFTDWATKPTRYCVQAALWVTSSIVRQVIPVFPLSLKSRFLGQKQCHVLLDMCSWVDTKKVSKAFSKFRDDTRNMIGSESKSESKWCN